MNKTLVSELEEPFITTALYIGGPRDGGCAKVVLYEPQLDWWIQIDDPDHERSLEEFNDPNIFEIWEQPWGWEVRVQVYNGFAPRTLLGCFGYYQIANDGNYHWHLYRE